jgi:hypothetical protein
MKQPTAQQKHDILIHCGLRRAYESEVNVAALHGVIASRETIWRWKKKWNGTAQSLERKEGTGNTYILTPSEVSRHIRAPILAANRAHRAIHYTDMWQQVKSKTGKRISLRTLQQYGKETLGIKEKTARKRTQAECECKQTKRFA